VTLEGYRDIIREVEVKPGEDMMLDLGEMDPKAGAVEFNITLSGNSELTVESLISELKVELDGKEFPYGAPELNGILEGSHTVRLLHPMFASDLVEFDVADAQTSRLDMVMGQLPGIVEMHLDDSLKSAIYVDGKPAKLVNGLLNLPAEREVKVEVRTHNYLSVFRNFYLKSKQREVWEVTPERIPGPEFKKQWMVPYLGLNMAWIPAGDFVMGSPMEEHARLPNEGPATEVRFTRGFWAGVFEVTQNQYRSIMQKNPSEFIDGRSPVDSVTWEEAKTYCDYLTRIEAAAGRLPEGYVYRLPTEPEWEYFARAGTTTPFHFGDTANSSNGNFKGVYPRERFEAMETTTVYGSTTAGRFPPNAWGLYDVHGNVQEWTLDIYNGRLPGEDLVDPAPRTAGSRVAVRGGSWQDSAVWSRSAYRREMRPNSEDSATGFRVILAPEF